MSEIVGLHEWFQSPAGQYLLRWEQSRFDAAVADCFGYHALQLGLVQMDGLRTNRMPHRWMAVSSPADVSLLSGEQLNDMQENESVETLRQKIDLVTQFNELPFASASLDLVLLPHALEFAPDPHATLREVERVLVPEGRAVVSGFNHWSLWGARQGVSRAFGKPFLPRTGEFIGYRRIKDWLRLLSFEIETGHFGCYRPPMRTEAWLKRYAFMDKAGDRWWPVLGAAYCMVAVKRVRGMRLITPVRRAQGFVPSSGLRPAANTNAHSTGITSTKNQE